MILRFIARNFVTMAAVLREVLDAVDLSSSLLVPYTVKQLAGPCASPFAPMADEVYDSWNLCRILCGECLASFPGPCDGLCTAPWFALH